ncbi:MAG TPA: hypothetical protein VFJ82_06940 [Longimicrobium sp.]|nr:hypothetical protein [Longimicrobium sp.]
MNRVTFSPDLRMRNLDATTTQRAIAAFDAEPSFPRPNTLRLSLNVVINAIRIWSGNGVRRKPRFIACKSVDIEVIALKGKIVDRSAPQSVEVAVKNSSSRSGSLQPSIAPEASIETGATKASIKVGAIAGERKVTTTSEIAYDTTERVLNPIDYTSAVRWELVQPAGEKVISQFITGNLEVFAEATWPLAYGSGRINVVPVDVDYYNAERHPLGAFRRLAMEYLLWKRGFKPTYLDGVRISFYTDGGNQ